MRREREAATAHAVFLRDELVAAKTAAAAFQQSAEYADASVLALTNLQQQAAEAGARAGEQVIRLQGEVTSARSAAQAEALAEIVAARSDADQLRQSVSEKEAAVAQLASALEGLRAQHADSDAQHAQHEHDLEIKLQSQLREASDDRDAAADKLAAAQGSQQEVHVKLREASEVQQELHAQMARARNESTESERRVVAARAEVAGLSEQVTHLLAELQAARKETAERDAEREVEWEAGRAEAAIKAGAELQGQAQYRIASDQVQLLQVTLLLLPSSRL